MLQHRDDARRAEGPVRERKLLCGADDERDSIGHALRLRHSACRADTGQGEVAPRSRHAQPGGLDHRRARAADSDVEIGPAGARHVERREDPFVEADPPVLGCVVAVLVVLGVEVLLLMLLLTRKPRADQYRNAVDDREARSATLALERVALLAEATPARRADDFDAGRDL